MVQSLKPSRTIALPRLQWLRQCPSIWIRRFCTIWVRLQDPHSWGTWYQHIYCINYIQIRGMSTPTDLKEIGAHILERKAIKLCMLCQIQVLNFGRTCWTLATYSWLALIRKMVVEPEWNPVDKLRVAGPCPAKEERGASMVTPKYPQYSYGRGRGKGLFALF